MHIFGISLYPLSPYMEFQKNHNLKGMPTKTFQLDGHWTHRKVKTEVIICTCGNKYIKTRPNQIVCVRCIGVQITEKRKSKAKN